MSLEKSPIKYFAYLRKSSEQEDRQMLSISSQREELKIIADKDDLKIVDWFEESHSAKVPNSRPDFKTMVERINMGEASGILVWHPNRLSRNAVDTGTLIYLLDLNTVVEVRTPQQTYRNTPDNKFWLSFLCMQAKLENDNKGIDVKRGLNSKAKLGWRPSGAPIGYRNTPDKPKGYKTIEKDPERFYLVRRMWDLMLAGQYTAAEVWKQSKEWGLTTVPHRNIGGKHLTRSYVYKNIFKNSFYYGWFQYKDKDTGELVWQKGQHEPMICEWEYNLVQERLGRKGAPRPKTHHEMAFTGSLMRCASCGSSITAEPKVKQQKNGNVHHYVYYHCTHKKNPNCTEKSIELKELNRQVLELLESVTISEKFKAWALKHLSEIRTTEAENQEKDLRKKHAELEVINKQLDGLLLRYTSLQNADSSLISNNEYQSMKGTLLNRKNSLESDLADKGREKEQWLELSEKTFNFACYARVWFENGDKVTKRSILACLGSNLVLKDQKINVDLHPFFLTIMENKHSLDSEEVSARTSKKPMSKRQKDSFESLGPTLLRTVEAVRTWVIAGGRDFYVPVVV